MGTLLTILIGLHNIFRWVWVLAAVAMLIATFHGWLTKRAYTTADKGIGSAFVGLLDLQLLLGVILYFIGNWGIKAFSLDGGMSVLFFAIEHATTMLIAVVVAHIGSARVKKAATDLSKHRLSALFFTLAFLLVMVAIPWATRPLLPSF